MGIYQGRVDLSGDNAPATIYFGLRELQRQREGEIKVEYVPHPDGPTFMSETSRGDVYLYGAYKVIFPDGKFVMHSHTAHKGTIGEEPVDLNLNPVYRDFLIEEAEAMRAARESGGDVIQ